MFLAVVMAMSVASVPVLAVEKADAYGKNNSGEVIRSGVLPNGIAYRITALTPEEIQEMDELEAAGHNTSKLSKASNEFLIWSGKELVPIQNYEGTNGKQIGPEFSIYPNNKVEIRVGRLSTVMPTVNIGISDVNGSWGDWEIAVGAEQKVEFSPYGALDAHRYVVKVSTQEKESRSASFAIYSKSE